MTCLPVLCPDRLVEGLVFVGVEQNLRYDENYVTERESKSSKTPWRN